jgi:CHAT domain-containing protein/tetratricopeptide (TPR) repeat protein
VNGSVGDQAREALRLAEAEPAKAAVLARDVASQGRRDRDLSALSVAERVLGITALQLEDPDTSLRHLRAAVRLGRRAGSAELAAEAQMRLAFVLNVLGRGRQALREVETALSCLTGAAHARGLGQRGVILSQLGRLEEALPDYQAALSVLRRVDDHVWVQRVLYNRAVTHGYRQEFSAAEADLHEAERLCDKHGLDLSLGFVHENLGWISSLRGDVPAALRYLDVAEQRLRAHGAPVGELLTDRCQVLLSARLLPEALQAAEQAVVEFSSQRRNIVLPEARVLLAQVAVLDGQAGTGLQQARLAAREFGRQGRRGWAALARFTALQARLAPGQQRGAGPGVGVRSVEQLADDLTEAGWPVSALEARLLAGQLAARRGWASRAQAQFQQAAQHRRTGSALQRAQGWHAEALRRWARGDRRGALAATRTALRVMDEHRAGLGATDLRAHASAHRVQVAELGLRMAFETGPPARVLEWAEQGRARHLMLRPVRPPADPSLAAALAELRTTVSEISRLHRAGGSTAQLRHHQVVLEQRIRDRNRQLPPGQAVAPVRHARARRIRESIGDAALLEFVQFNDALYVVTVTSRRIRLCRLCPAAQAGELVTRASFALHRLARRHPDNAADAAAGALLADAARRLDALLIQPVTREVGDRPLIMVPTGALQSLPWSILPSCAGRPVTMTPAAALWASQPQADGEYGPPLVAAGPGLPGASTEASVIAGLHQVTALAGPAATVQAVTTGLDGAYLAHLAAHGRIHPDNPLFTSLWFDDGPLTVYDVERLARPPRVVVLAACDVGRSAVRAGDEIMGLSAAFLALGTRQVIASVVPIPDAETAPLMITFHKLLANGESAASSLALAQQRLSRSRPTAMAAAAGFVCIGPGTTLAAP